MGFSQAVYCYSSPSHLGALLPCFIVLDWRTLGYHHSELLLLKAALLASQGSQPSTQDLSRLAAAGTLRAKHAAINVLNSCARSPAKCLHGSRCEASNYCAVSLMGIGSKGMSRIGGVMVREWRGLGAGRKMGGWVEKHRR